MIIGRAPGCDLRVDDEYASPLHCEVYQAQDLWWVRDLGAINPVRVLPAGRAAATHFEALARSTEAGVGGQLPIRPGDILIVGRTQIPYEAIVRPPIQVQAQVGEHG